MAFQPRLFDGAFTPTLVFARCAGATPCRPFLPFARRFVLCRTRVKEVLAFYGRSEPRDIHFAYGPWGKPFWGAHCFNYANSQEQAVLAVSSACGVGLDLENMGRSADIRGISELFHPGERFEFGACPPAYGFALICCSRARGIFLTPENAAGQGACESLPQLCWMKIARIPDTS